MIHGTLPKKVVNNLEFQLDILAYLIGLMNKKQGGKTIISFGRARIEVPTLITVVTNVEEVI